MNRNSLISIGLVLLSASFAAHAADTCAVQLSGDDMMKYDRSNIDVPKRCRTFVINLRHTGKLPRAAMGHNVVVASMADLPSVAADGMRAGAANQYVKPDDARIIAKSGMIGGGESTSVSIPVARLSTGPYGFTCTFPGHSALMKGTLTLK